jgi:carbon monoxide dehydrogenase subunit G
VSVVWKALNDPEVLRICIPGCEEVRQISPEELHARVLLKLGPVRANFIGKVKLTDIHPLQGYKLEFEGSGGPAGFAKGSSVVTLSECPEGTLLEYTAQASVAGKLGQIGGRMIDASARQLAAQFFATFKAHISEGVSAVRQPEQAPSAVLPEAGIPDGTHWFDREKSRLLWFLAGSASTALGVWIGAHGLR